MQFPDDSVWLEEGAFSSGARAVDHRPVAEEEARVLLFEPASTVHTGGLESERTVRSPERI